MPPQIGPVPFGRIVLCSADASPSSQRDWPGPAGSFFPGARWVGAVRNVATRCNCQFAILTTGHGLVEPDTIIGPYDAHIDEHRGEVARRWSLTIPAVLGGYRNGLMVFYAGGCPRDAYLELFVPILRDLAISLLSFGKPNMYDVNRIDTCVDMIEQGTSLDRIAAILRYPERLVYCSHA
jgi:hypothetical protein